MGPAATLSDVCSDLVVQVILNKMFSLSLVLV